MRLKRIAHYQVTAKIGEGGMGEVYQARDTKLDRDVALKVLPEAFTSDPDRLARFEREAKVLASLNHPNIGTIYGLEEAEGVKALVLELVEGPTLADRIKQGPIPVDEALPIAKQIAEALEAAHEQGVIHRDLKPANIKVKDDGTVKVLDFGLAKAFQPDAADPGLSASPTISLTAAATQMGMVIGTAAYMAPEQAKGLPVDKRADIWAFGVVLYEMLTGQALFAGPTVSDTLASVLKTEPDWRTLPADTPALLRRVLRRCLEKDRKQRFQHIGDTRADIDDARSDTPLSSEIAPIAEFAVWQRPTVISFMILVAAIVAGFAVWAVMRPEPTPVPSLMRFTVVPPETAPLGPGVNHASLAISADGSRIVYAGPTPDGRFQLYVHSFDDPPAVPLRGTNGGYAPFLSPDGASVGFVDPRGPIYRVSIFGGPPMTLTESDSTIRGASWGADDRIIFGTNGAGLFLVSGGSGEPHALTTPNTEQGEVSHQWPFIIPGRDAVVFVIASATSTLATGQLAVLDFNTQDIKRLGVAGVSPHYVSTGHLVYAAEDATLRAVPFDAATLEVTGDPVSLVEDVAVKNSGAADFDISDNGRLVYRPSSTDAGSLTSRLVLKGWDGDRNPLADIGGLVLAPAIFSRRLESRVLGFGWVGSRERFEPMGARYRTGNTDAINIRGERQIPRVVA